MEYRIRLNEFLPSSVQSILLCAIGCLSIWLYLSHSKSKKYTFPPGPKGLPIVGNMLDFSNKAPHLLFADWSKIYGGIFTVSALGRKSVILSDVTHVKEAMVQCSPKVDSKSPWRYCFIRLLRGLSVIPYSKKWVNTRRRTLFILREFGMGKSALELRIYDEAKFLVKNMLEASDNCRRNIEVKNIVNRAPVNIICKMLFNERYAYDDADMTFIIRTIDELLAFLQTACIYDSLPPLLRPLMENSLEDFHRKLDVLAEFLNLRVRKHEETYSDSMQRDFVDAWIKISRKNGENSKNNNVKNGITNDKANGNTSYIRNVKNVINGGTNGHLHSNNDKIQHPLECANEKDISPLAYVLQDVIIAGAHSSGVALNWLVLMLTMHKEIQDKMYEDILQQIGPKQRATSSDRNMLPFIDAFIYETLRVSTMVPLIGHSCCTDVSLSGYQIPAGVEVTYNNWALHHDENYFPSSYVFQPDRWINSDGTFNKVLAGNFFPFGLGKRICAGESLAKTELFITTVTLVQNFEFLPPDDTVPENLKPELEHILSFVTQPKRYLIGLRERPKN